MQGIHKAVAAAGVDQKTFASEGGKLMEYHMRQEPYTSVVVPNFPPEGTAPPVDMADPEYNPYLDERMVRDAAV